MDQRRRNQSADYARLAAESIRAFETFAHVAFVKGAF